MSGGCRAHRQTRLRELKEQLDMLNGDMEKAEREFDLERAAEIKSAPPRRRRRRARPALRHHRSGPPACRPALVPLCEIGPKARAHNSSSCVTQVP